MNPVSLLTIVGGVLAAAVVVGLVLLLRDPAAARRRVESIFRQPPEPHKLAGNEQYYRPYWSR